MISWSKILEQLLTIRNKNTHFFSLFLKKQLKASYSTLKMKSAYSTNNSNDVNN